MKVCKHCHTDYDGTRMPDGKHDCDYQNSDRLESAIKDIVKLRKLLKNAACSDECRLYIKYHTIECEAASKLLEKTKIWESFK